MKSGTCPKCHGRNIRVDAGVSFKRSAHGAISISWWHFAILDCYVCIDCGFTESYVPDAKKLAMIGEKWPKVTKSSRPTPS